MACGSSATTALLTCCATPPSVPSALYRAATQTTLILVLSGRVPGDVDVFNQAGDTVLLTQSRYRRRVGFVPQDDILHPDLTVRENLDYSARFRLPLKVALVLHSCGVHACMLQSARACLRVLCATLALSVAAASGGMARRPCEPHGRMLREAAGMQRHPACSLYRVQHPARPQVHSLHRPVCGTRRRSSAVPHTPICL